ncbi:Alkaline phosphatase precursor [Corynebacterium ciconiae DSM 44920]|uniref:alkaline phosphatase n=1 Tax=Corynebacterium ciconiae TaxID=227319 RepID=UPI0003724082|nr:alkaline phosphatase [Corynebacterium ciconiae]WKD60982.1 Alkaline phosphatase precursor [Corynebacterium ciconiae DSM 44920]
MAISTRTARLSLAGLLIVALTGFGLNHSAFDPSQRMQAPLAVAETPTPDTPAGDMSNCRVVGEDGSVVAPGPGDCARFGTAGQGRSAAKARNVILIVGDGMDQQTITAARNYLKGAGGRFEGIDNLPATGAYTHHSIDRDGSFNLVTDSAASATAWSTGTKTYNGAIGVDLEGKPVRNVVEMAKERGMRTGNVTTSEIQDATPAAMGAHAVDRACYGPEEDKQERCRGGEYSAQYRENGGLGSISEQLVETRADITLGGGRESLEHIVQESGPARSPFIDSDMQWHKGRSVLDNAIDAGYTVVTTAEELRSVDHASVEHPVLGVFNDGNLTTRFAPSSASVGGAQRAPDTCTPNNIGTEPELAEMTSTALRLLDEPKSDKGFFLQIESASIDKRHHAADACGMIGEVERIDEAVKEALDFAREDGETLVVLAADHAHSAQILPDGTESVSPATRLTTADGVGQAIGYGTLPAGVIEGEEKFSTQHNGSELRVAAFGPGAENVIGGIDQTDLHYVMANALRLGDWEVAQSSSFDTIDLSTAAAPRDDVRETCYLVRADGRAPQPGDCAHYGRSGHGLSTEKAKNVVMMISDGTGNSEITSARNYLVGPSGRLPGYDNFDFTGSATTYALSASTGQPDLVTDSAASGSAWNSGIKTYNGAVGVDVAGAPVPTMAELAKAKGMKIGNVTTAEVQDATPAAFAAHAAHRKCYGPEKDKNNEKCQGPEMDAQYRENGGLGSISEQIVDLRADVTFGGGREAFEQIVQRGGTWAGNTWTEGKSVVDNAKEQGYQVVSTTEEMQRLREANTAHPVLGLFAPGNMPRHNSQSIPTEDGAVAPAQQCRANPERGPQIPTLEQMTTTALELLRNEEGFLLQVEAASVDKAGHDADACGQFGEFSDYDATLAAVRDWVEATGEPTLIISTTDHAHTSQITNPGALTAGRTITVAGTTPGVEMTMNYATAPSNEEDVALGGQTHTGAQIQVAASGPGAQNVVGQLDQTDIFYVVAQALGLDTDPTAIDLSPQWDKQTQYDATSPNSHTLWWLLAGVAVIVVVGSIAYATSRSRSA